MLHFYLSQAYLKVITTVFCTVLRTEFTSVVHYHDFYEVVIYLGNAGVFQIEGSEYLVRRGDIVLIDMFKPHTLIANKNSYYERFSVSINLNLLIAYSTFPI